MTSRSKPPTAAQLRVLRTINRLSRQEIVPPTVRELQEELGIQSTNGVRSHLLALKHKKLVEQPSSRRSSSLTEEGAALVQRQKE